MKLEHSIIILTKTADRIAVLPFVYAPSAWDNLERMKAIADQYLADTGMTMADHAYLEGSLKVWID